MRRYTNKTDRVARRRIRSSITTPVDEPHDSSRGPPKTCSGYDLHHPLTSQYPGGLGESQVPSLSSTLFSLSHRLAQSSPTRCGPYQTLSKLVLLSPQIRGPINLNCGNRQGLSINRRLTVVVYVKLDRSTSPSPTRRVVSGA